MKIKPLGTRVLLKPKTEEKTKGGIYIPDTADNSINEGEIVDIGETKKDGPIKVGDIVMYEPRSVIEVTIDDEKHFIMNVSNIIAKID